MLAAGGGSDAEAKRIAEEFQKLVLDVIAEKTAVMAANDRAKKTYLPDPGEARAALPGDLIQFERFQYKQLLVEKVMNPHRFYVWLDVVQGEQASQDYEKKDGIYEYDFKRAVRFYTAEQKTKLNAMLAELKNLEKDMPPEYPYVMGIADNPAADQSAARISAAIRTRSGDVVPRGLPGFSGRGAVYKRQRTAWSWPRRSCGIRSLRASSRIEFGCITSAAASSPRPAISETGGEPPTHPELLDYLASRLIENHWSIKALHREILLSAT